MKIKGTKLSTRTLALLAAAVVLLTSGGFMGTRAAISAVGDDYDATIATNKIDVSLVDADGKTIEALMGDVDPEKGIIPGRNYDQTVKVKAEEDAADAYVRVIVRKYWKNDNEKTNAIKPEAIQLINSGKDITGSDWTSGGNWIKNKGECTPETYVFYYSPVLKAGTTSDPLFTAVRVDESVLSDVTTKETEKDGYTTIIYEYKFDGYTVCVEAEAQAVQTHNPKDAIKSVWGVDATVSGDKITKVN